MCKRNNIVFFVCLCSVCVRGEFGNSCGGHVPGDVQKRLPQGAADPRHVYRLFPHRTHYVYGGKAQ